MRKRCLQSDVINNFITFVLGRDASLLRCRWRRHMWWFAKWGEVWLHGGMGLVGQLHTYAGNDPLKNNEIYN